MTLAPSLRDLSEQGGRRARLASLLGRLLLEEPGPDLVPLVAGVPALAGLGNDDPTLAVDFERLLLRDVAPYESVFTSADGQRGGDTTATLAAFYERFGYGDDPVARRVAGVDHLGVQLRCYAHLCAEESAAWRDEFPDRAARCVEAERTLLTDHFGTWAEVAAIALRREAAGSPYEAVAVAVSEFVADESARLRPAPDHDGLAPVAVEPAPRRTGPAGLARWLLAPGRCGAFLSADDFGAASLALGIPWRPSDTRSRFRRSVEAATDGGDLHALLDHLRPAVEAWSDLHGDRERGREGEARIWRAWRLRSEETLALIDRVRATARATSMPSPASPFVDVAVHPPFRTSAAGVVGLLQSLGLHVAVSVDLPAGLDRELAAILTLHPGAIILAGPAVAAEAVPVDPAAIAADVVVHLDVDGGVTHLGVAPAHVPNVTASLGGPAAVSEAPAV